MTMSGRSSGMGWRLAVVAFVGMANYAQALTPAVGSGAFVARHCQPTTGMAGGPGWRRAAARGRAARTTTSMGLLDYVNPNYWKREYIVAAMLTNQIPKSAAVVVDLAPRDPKRLFYLPMTARQVVVVQSTASEKEMKEAAGQLAKLRPKLEIVEKVELALPPNSVDVVCCCQALERLDDSRGTIAAAYRSLKPGGRLIFVEPIEVRVI
mmetsp:Transcript_18005/g.47309  ORF Transcript_18005/g.47309 Transcript_18005/m.47309 type:complete len:209 (+) Transcript_18005:1309-1935(+)